MFISLDWISDFVDLEGIDPATIADRLTMATAEVEGVTTLTRNLAGVLTGRIVEAEPILERAGGEVPVKTLTRCVVDCGTGRFSTLCGAPNAHVGLIAAFAPAGISLGEKKILAAEVAGCKSEGILCSAAELGLSDWHEMLFEFPTDTPVGVPLERLFPPTDTRIEIDNKSLTHRPDLWGHYGFARELSAIFHRPLRPMPLDDLGRYAHLLEYPIELADANCPCYGGILFGVASGSMNIPSPLVMQRRLHALGQRTHNLLIDVTNYVSLELGQPTHAFDADTISSIRVAPFGSSGCFTTLDGRERSMQADDMMIWDSSEGGTDAEKKPARPIAIAGIMGGQETEVTSQTTRVLLESANFTPKRIRLTAARLDLRSDASQRYEKSQPPANVKTAAARILRLLADSGTPLTVESRFSLAGDAAEQRRFITLPPGRLNARAGIEFSDETVTSILTAIGFTAEFSPDGTLTVGVPPFRSVKDISIPEDIVEEVTRLYGFDNIPPVMPEMPISPLFIEKSIRLEHRARRLLAGTWGFWEVHNYGWFNDPFLGKIGFDPGETLTLLNPAAQPESRLRTTLIPNLLALVPKNRPMFDRFRVFEIGHVYLPVGTIDDPTPCRDSAEKCRELPRLSGVSYLAAGMSLEEHYLTIKGAVEDLGRLFGQEEFTLGFEEADDEADNGIHGATNGGSAPWRRPGHSVRILQHGPQSTRTVGEMGVADRELLSALVPEGGQVVWFELALDMFEGNLYPTLKFVEPPKFPGSWLDFSLVWPLEQGYRRLENLLDEFSDPLLLRREFLTVYKGKGVAPGTASYSFRFLIGAADHTLSGGEIDRFHKKYLSFLESKSIPLR